MRMMFSRVWSCLFISCCGEGCCENDVQPCVILSVHQLLEQAIIIEEQLRKAARVNKQHYDAAVRELQEKGVDITDS